MDNVAQSTAAGQAHPSDRGARVSAADAADDRVALAAHLTRQFAALDLLQRVAAIRSQIPGRIVFTTSFGLEDQAVSHAIFSQALAIDVATLDTGRLFPETHEVWAETERRYGVRVHAFAPERTRVEALVAKQGVYGFRSSIDARHECCAIRKVAPLGRALAVSAGWITGVRAEQTADRANMAFASYDARHDLIKVNPLLDWSRDQTVDFVHRLAIPYNALHDRGFASIGCAPCTRAVAPGEPERAGRWWWEQAEKKECGLHLTADGRLTHA